jgi:hypothetical protein
MLEPAMLEDAAWIAAVVAAFVAALAVRAANRPRRRQFETIYVQRYWSLMDQLSLEALQGRSQPLIRTSDQRLIRSYLRLCEDELELHREGWISQETWKIWQTGISAQLRRWPFLTVWREVERETRPTDTAPGEFELLRAFVGNPQDRRLVYPWWRRTLRALARWVTGGP